MNATLAPPPAPINELLDKVRREGEAKYRLAVLSLAAGETIDPSTLGGILAAANRSQDDLLRHIEQAHERREAIERPAELAAREPEIDALQVDCDALDEQLQAAKAEYEAKIAPLQQQRRSGGSAIGRFRLERREALRDAGRVLNHTASSDLKQRFQLLSHRLGGCQSKLASDRQKAAGMERRLSEADADVSAIESTIERWESQPDSVMKVEGLASNRAKLPTAIAARDELLKLQANVTKAEIDLRDAEVAKAKFETEDFLDWRQMNFD